MAGSSQSDDVSDIFWPGYVDAVTNLAINLLFVIAVLAIVVIAAVLQLSITKPGDTGSEQKTNEAHPVVVSESAQVVNPTQNAPVSKSLQSAQAKLASTLKASEQGLKNLQSATQSASDSQKTVVLQAAQALAQSVQQQRTLVQDMAQLQASVSKLESRLAQVQSHQGSQAADPPDVQKVQEIRAHAKVVKSDTGNSQVQGNASGVVVVFDRDVIELSSKEGTQLMSTLSNSGSVVGAKWELRVAAPKGFSEAIRIAFYRLTSVRNTLIENGVPAANIDMRVLEVPSAAANNNRVQVRRVP